MIHSRIWNQRVGYLSEIIGPNQASVFPVYAICFIETVHDKWCLDKSGKQTENGLARSSVKNGLNSV